MSKLKGVKKLNKKISEQLARFGIEGAFLDEGYSYLPNDNFVTFKVTIDLEDKFFTDFVEDRFNFKDENPFLTGLLHEVGHAMTWDFLTDEMLDFCYNEKARIDEEMKDAKTVQEVAKLEWQYFNLPDEILATAWAVGYIKEHPKKTKKMWNKMQKALNKFYQKNGITE